jgi:serine/threonine protein kinase
MSPEQIRGDYVDPHTDIFSFGIVLYEMLVGRHPFLRQNPVETLSAILREPPPPAPELPAGLRRVLDRCLAKDPGERWPSAEALDAGLREAARPPGALEMLKGLFRPSR